jgi:DNA-directed RNA polymerase specialized sigma24 family protein
MSRRSQQESLSVGGGWPAAGRRAPGVDQVEELARVACARRELLLRVHGRELRREDLEDCYSQATLELLASARGARRYASRGHMAAAIEQRFVSRIRDRRRAVSGRSPMQAALERSVPLAGHGEESVGLLDVRAELESLVILRQELRLLAVLARELTHDQRLVLACQVGLQMTGGEFCERFGWSPEKYRKVAQRGRARLSILMSREEPIVTRRVG